MNWFTTGPGPANDHWNSPGELGFDVLAASDSMDLKKLKYGCARFWTGSNASSYDNPGLVVAKTYTGNPAGRSDRPITVGEPIGSSHCSWVESSLTTIGPPSR